MSILEVSGVSIRYLTGDFKEIGLKEYILRRIKGNYEITEFWADRDITFSLEQGDMLGIIGGNGAGKSTLLKVVSGIMEPSKGSVNREGTIAALLELGSGFDGDLTVRENTYLRGAMLGYTRSFMDETYNQIIEFAELQEFQDRPFKQLSSGMKARLAFSIASLVRPDILILDEVLSVGDGAFKKKSETKMREIISGGATTILVSHSVQQVREMCNKVLWLHEGRQIEFGKDVNGICDRYEEFLENKRDGKKTIGQITKGSKTANLEHRKLTGAKNKVEDTGSVSRENGFSLLEGALRPNGMSVQTLYLMITFAVLIFFRCALSARLPPYIISNSSWDDAWMVSRAEFLLKGEWLGPYEQHTLIKGVFSPLLMAAAYKIGVPYMGINTALYCVSCVVFILAISPVISKAWIKASAFAVLLFNPISYALSTWQRVYRNGISQWQLLLIFGSIFAVYIRREWSWKVLLKWEILAGVALWSFMNTREDGVWLYPFVFCAIILTIVVSCRKNKGWKICKTALFALPLIILVLGNGSLKIIQTSVYGAPVVNDRSEGNYAKVMKDLYLIEPDPEDEKKFTSPKYKDQYYNIYTSTLKKAYSVSPTLNAMRVEIDAAVKRWDSNDAVVDGEPYADHILFAIREGIAAAGHYKDLAETEALYAQIHEELTQAFQEGSIVKRGLSISALTAPFQWKYIPDILREIPVTIRIVLTFDKVSSQIMKPTGSSIQKFEQIAGSRGIDVPQKAITLKGWAFAYQNNTRLSASIYAGDGTKMADVQFLQSEGVFEHFVQKTSTAYDNAHVCRFNMSINGYSFSDEPILRLVNEIGEVVEDIPLSGFQTGKIMYYDDVCLCFDILNDDLTGDTILYNGTIAYVNRANKVIDLYRHINPILFALAVIIYIGLVVRLLRNPQKISPSHAAVCLLLTGVLLSMLLFAACMAYMTVTTFSAHSYMYLSSAYVLCLMFNSVSVCWGVQEVFGLIGKAKI